MNIGIVLSSLLVSMMIFSWEMEFAFVEPEGEGFPPIVMYSLVGYLLYLLRYFVVNEEKKYTVSAFSISVMVSTVVIVTYDQRVGGHFWNDDYVLEEALLASVQSTIILFVINELAGIAFGAYNSSANAKRNYPTSPIRTGLIASLPLVVMNPPWALGLVLLIPILTLFFVLYWASTDPPSILVDH